MINFYKVSSLPSTLEASSFYFVENGNFAESYITDNTGVAKSIGNSSMINQLIAAQLATVSTGSVRDVPNIAARDDETYDGNSMVLVYDASDDPEVTSGAAMYYYDTSAEVSQSHSHTNLAVLNALSDDGGTLNYEGSPIDTTISFVQTNW